MLKTQHRAWSIMTSKRPQFNGQQQPVTRTFATVRMVVTLSLAVLLLLLLPRTSEAADLDRPADADDKDLLPQLPQLPDAALQLAGAIGENPTADLICARRSTKQSRWPALAYKPAAFPSPNASSQVGRALGQGGCVSDAAGATEATG